MVQGLQWVPSGPMYAKSIYWFKVFKGYLVQGVGINDQSPNIKISKVPSDFPIKYGPKTLKNP